MSFEAATAVTPAGEGAFEALCSTDWSAPNGPNGGYLAAIVLRAMAAHIGDAAYAPRSLTCHYLRPPTDGPVRLEVVQERRGRTVASTSARLLQGDRLCVTALGAFTTAGDAPGWEPPMPAVPPASEVEPWPVHPRMPPIAQRLELRHCVGAAPFSGADDATSGGWMRVRGDATPLDAPAVALLADAWLPAAFPRLTAPAAAPTIDLTVHFRRAAPAPGEQVLGVFTSTCSAEGLFEEDGALWSEDGLLLAQSRQLALLR